MINLIALLLATMVLSSCGAELKQTQSIDGNAELVLRIEVAFPDCAGIEDDALRVRCVETAASAVVAIAGSLSEEQLQLIEELGAVVDEP